MKMIDLLLGRRLANREGEEQKIGWFAAVPAMGLDGLGSSSYGPEAALTILIPLGAASLAWIGWVLAPVVLLLAILYLSYRQTIVAYPHNGGVYTVAKENLGTAAALLAAAALMIDYVLNVAVGISAGIGALTSSAPSLQPWTLELCLGILLLVSLANLRGTREAGWLFALPTYLFIASFLLLIGLGIARVAEGDVHPLIAPPPPGQAMEAAGAWLLVRAFAAGCTAMTGVEAVSDGVNAFREPVVKEAHRTLTVICLTLGLLIAGVATVAHGYGLVAMDQTRAGYQSVMSQLAGAIVGHGLIYYVAMASLLAVLCLSANTSFVGFPRICRLVALDDYLPRSFAVAARRLGFSVGVLFDPEERADRADVHAESARHGGALAQAGGGPSRPPAHQRYRRGRHVGCPSRDPRRQVPGGRMDRGACRAGHHRAAGLHQALLCRAGAPAGRRRALPCRGNRAADGARRL